jgi:hypothetical protein
MGDELPNAKQICQKVIATVLYRSKQPKKMVAVTFFNSVIPDEKSVVVSRKNGGCHLFYAA